MNASGSNFVFVIETGFTLHAFSSAAEVLRLARRLGDENQVSYALTTLEDGPVCASNGIAIVPNCAPEPLQRGAIIVVVSGAGAVNEPNPKLAGYLRQKARIGHPVWAISSGVVRLAQAGLVNGQKVAAHWEDVPYLRDHHPDVEISTSLFISKARHPTCSGGGASADLMLDYLGFNGSDSLVEDIASRLMLDGVRDGRLSQSLPENMRYTTSNKSVFAAVRLMEAYCFDPLPIHEISSRVGLSQRQLERLFKAEFERTPAFVYAELRMAEARQEVIVGRRPICDIALDFGYSTANFSKVYRRVFGVLPSQDRKKSKPAMS